MTAINNLKGHIVKDGKVVYSEKLDNGFYFIVVQMYENIYAKFNWGSSSSFILETIITDGKVQHWSNGVDSFWPTREEERIKEEESFRKLKETKTKQGFKVWEHPYGEEHFKETKNKRRFITWIIEVPKEELIKFIEIDGR